MRDPKKRPNLSEDPTIEELVEWTLRYGDLVFNGRSQFLKAIPVMVQNNLITIKHVSTNTSSISVYVEVISDNLIGYPGYKIDTVYKVPMRSAVMDTLLYHRWKEAGLI